MLPFKTIVTTEIVDVSMSRNIPDSISISLDKLYLFKFFDLSVHLEDNSDIIKEALILFVKEMLRGTSRNDDFWRNTGCSIVATLFLIVATLSPKKIDVANRLE